MSNQYMGDEAKLVFRYLRCDEELEKMGFDLLVSDHNFAVHGEFTAKNGSDCVTVYQVYYTIDQVEGFVDAWKLHSEIDCKQSS